MRGLTRTLNWSDKGKFTLASVVNGYIVGQTFTDMPPKTKRRNPLNPQNSSSGIGRFLYGSDLNSDRGAPTTPPKSGSPFDYSDEEKDTLAAMKAGRGIKQGRERLEQHSQDNQDAANAAKELKRRQGYREGSGLDRWADLQEGGFNTTRPLQQKRALPESFSHKLGVATRRARRLGLNPNNTSLLQSIMQGRDNDAGIESHAASTLIGKQKEEMIDRQFGDINSPDRYADDEEDLDNSDVGAQLDEDFNAVDTRIPKAKPYRGLGRNPRSKIPIAGGVTKRKPTRSIFDS